MRQVRSTQRYKRAESPDQDRLRARVIEIATEYGRYGYRQVTRLLKLEGWTERPNHVWSYDFVADQTHDGRPIKIFNVIDEFTRECLASVVMGRIRSQEVLMILVDLMLERGCPTHVRSDNGPEFIAKNLMNGFKTLEVQPLFIEPGSPWENGYCESFNGKMRYELLNGEIFFALKEAQVVIESWCRHYNTVRPQSSLGARSPAPETKQPELPS